ncbi:putative rhomboid protease YdcA [Caldalkalibacillus thermarum]|uniref:rhomboid family intramembrane serine protease n=1 Tax=Caldalkalibacillus thermarum TaxID=296745 RepID=UPI001667072F|nr:rhomboid family intramembrane serine protease [Caldalkalibacillus thermarum]GGK34996.1 putative rhomboid protease YdcA [Caldalkalibacillus thermarum]
MFIRTESFQQFIRYYPVVTALIAINTVLFVLIRFPGIGDMIRYYGVGQNLAIAMGEYWRLVTPIFLHYRLMHFLFNSFALIIFAPAMERLLGRWKFIGLYLATGVAGNVGTFLFGPDYYAHLGASGALYGLLGLYLYMVLFRKDLIDPASSQIVTTILVIGLFYTIVMPGVNLYAHLFGFLSGLAFGPLVFKGQMKYFTVLNDPAPSPVGAPPQIRFDPRRWQKSHKRRQILKYVLIGFVVFLIVLGMLNSLR